MIKALYKNTAPLCFLSNGRLLCYCRGQMLVMHDGVIERIIPIVISGKERLFGSFRLASRLFRFGVRASLELDDNYVILSIGNKLNELDIKSGKMTEGWHCGSGIRPLTLTNIKDFEGFDNGIYFGGYLHNPGKSPVHIYRRIGIDQWEVVYTFPQGAVNHVHNVIADPFRKCLWIFTGDFDQAAAIWKATDNFNEVECIVEGNQRWRGSVAFVLPEGLLYATDTPRADDYLYLLNPDTLEQKEVIPLHGSCIYGCEWKENYVFASTVECDGGDMGFFEYWFGRKRGKGIKDEYVHMYCGNLKEGFREIYKEKKDWLPFTLFQFGAFKFPAGKNDTDILYFQPIATSNNDLALMAIKE